MTTYPQGMKAETTTIFDSHGTPTVVTDPLGNNTYTTIRYDFSNSLGQHVLYQEVTDPLGNQTHVEHDALGRNSCLIRKNAFGKVTQKQESRYDANGNCCALIDTVISPDALDHQVITQMQYDSSNRLIACYEAVNTPEQKQTKITYNNVGQKFELIKADGTRIAHAYDAFGRLAALTSSDGTINYVYTYDLDWQPHPN